MKSPFVRGGGAGR